MRADAQLAGRPGLSPAQLATVCVLQFLLDLSDRDAVEAVRCRIDFKYALGLDLDDPGGLVTGLFIWRQIDDQRQRSLVTGGQYSMPAALRQNG